MQPYLLPYIGYFQLIKAVDRFVVYDNVKYTKRGWINRNRMLVNGQASTFSVPLRHDSDLLDVRERRIAPEFDRARLLNQIAGAYSKAPFFESAFALAQRIFGFEGDNLFGFLHHALSHTCDRLGIRTPVLVSSSLPVDHALRSQDKVIAICRQQTARTYVNPIGGTELYSTPAFAQEGIELRFLKSRPIEYRQFGAPFVPSLSILDVMMFNPPAAVDAWLTDGYDLN